MQENENILSKNELPPLNLRVKELIEHYANGSVKKFSEIIQLSSSQKINRIFNVDKRNGEFPEASSDILICIANMLSEVDMNWLLTGHGSMLRSDQEQPIPQPVIQSTPPGVDSFIYKMYEKKDEENKALIEEIGGLKERIRTLESKLQEYEPSPELPKGKIKGLGSSETAKPAHTKKHIPGSEHTFDPINLQTENP